MTVAIKDESIRPDVRDNNGTKATLYSQCDDVGWLSASEIMTVTAARYL